MHIISIILIIAILVYIFFIMSRRAAQAEPDSGSAPAGEADQSAGNNPKFAFISKGKLFVCDKGQTAEQVHSTYVQDMVDRMNRKKQVHGWKKDTSLSTSFVGATDDLAAGQVDIQVASAQFAADSKLLYFMQDSHVGGLFEYDAATQNENRLLHRQNLSYESLTVNPENHRILCSEHQANGMANIVVMDADGKNERELTEGDTVDTSPAWIPGEEDEILYQSSGLARSEEGYVIAYGPTSIELLNTGSGDVTSVLGDAQTDFMQPRVDSAGNLYFIRRPYEVHQYGGVNFLLDFVLFPFRLLRAVFHYLNFFSLMYSRKPLTTADGPKVNADIKDILIKGKRIDAEKALRKEGRVNGIPSLVPRSWQLVRRSKSGNETVLASSVASYDLTADDQILFSNGYAVFQLMPGNSPRVIFRDKLIADVIAA